MTLAVVTMFGLLNDVTDLRHNAFARSASANKTVFVYHLFESYNFNVIGSKNNQTLVSDAAREIPTLGSKDNAGN